MNEAIVVSESGVTSAQDPGSGGILNARSASVGKADASADAKPTLDRETAEGKAERPVVPVWGMVAGLSAAVSGSDEWARGRRATGGPRQISTHQRAYARDGSEKLSDASARSGVRGCTSRMAR